MTSVPFKASKYANRPVSFGLIVTNRQIFQRNKSAIQNVLERPQTKHVFLLDKRRSLLEIWLEVHNNI